MVVWPACLARVAIALDLGNSEVLRYEIIPVVRAEKKESVMGEEKTDIREVTIADDEPGVRQENAFDRLEARIDSLIERYEQLRSEHSRCGLELAEKEARIRELEAELESLQQQRSEVRGRLDALIEKLSRFSQGGSA